MQKNHMEENGTGLPTVIPVKMRHSLLVIVLAAASIPAVAQTSETTVTTTTRSTAPVAPPPPVATESVTTTRTFVQTRTLYLRSTYEGPVKAGSQVFIRPNGKIYDTDGDYVGHLTDLNGDDLKQIPSDRRYKIRSPKGVVIASTKLTSAFDGDRTVTLARQDMNGQVIAETVETTSVTTAPVPPPAVETSTTTTVTQSAPTRQTPP